MARKKEIKTGLHLKFIPTGGLADLERLALDNPHIKDTHVALCKYIETFSSIVEKAWNNNKKYVTCSTKYLKKKLKTDNIGATQILNDLVNSKFLLRDKSKFVLGEHPWEYAPVYKQLHLIALSKNFINKTTDVMLAEKDINHIGKELIPYSNVLSKLTMDNKIYDYMNNIYNNRLSTYRRIGRDIYDDSFVPCSVCVYDSFVPFTKSKIYEYDSFVPCEQISFYEGVSIVPLLYKVDAVSDFIDFKGIHEFDSSLPYKILGTIEAEFISVFKIITGNFKANRPKKDSRVYSNITNLQRGYRKFLRLNGLPLIGFDIANSQPMIAAIAFIRFSEFHYGKIMPDVLQYQKDCEVGRFYEYFMELNSIDTTDDDVRTKFKGDFFGSVFYTKEVEKENLLKTQFKERYPTCYEAIFTMKGGLYSEQYKAFPALMTEIETYIILETNMQLISEGFDVLNIFDSLYSDSKDAMDRAKDLTMQKFAEFGITPTLKDINYNENTALQALQITRTLNQSTVQSNPYTTAPKRAQNISVQFAETDNLKELKKPMERVLCPEEITMGFQDLEYYITTWERVLGLETAYIMYEEQFKKMVHPVKAMNYLKAV